jgi:hypothetical protein
MPMERKVGYSDVNKNDVIQGVGRLGKNDIKQWNSTFLAFSLIIEGATEKVLQFIMPVKTIYNKNLGFVE